MKIGFIGLGAMGKPMALNLCRKGFELYFHSSNPETAEEMRKAGAVEAADYHGIAQMADALITMIPSDAEIRQMYLGEDSLLEDLPECSFLIDMSTSSVAMMRELSGVLGERRPDVKLIDAPVSGGVGGAAAGTLTIMCGCESPELLEQVRDILSAMGTNIVYTGGVGCGSGVKIVNNMLLAVHTEFAAEALCMLRLLGLDPELAFRIINSSGGRSQVTENVVPNFMLTDNHDNPSFRLELMEKDVNLFLQEARGAHAFTPVAEMTGQMFKGAGNRPGNLKRNFTVISEWLKDNQPR